MRAVGGNRRLDGVVNRRIDGGIFGRSRRGLQGRLAFEGLEHLHAALDPALAVGAVIVLG